MQIARIGIATWLRNMLVALIVGAATVATGASAAAQPGADPTEATCQWVAGRQKVELTITGAPGEYGVGAFTPPSAFLLAEVEVGPSGSATIVRSLNLPGDHHFWVYVARPDTPPVPACSIDLYIAPSDPLLDAVDGALAGVGSSALSTDPTAR